MSSEIRPSFKSHRTPVVPAFASDDLARAYRDAALSLILEANSVNLVMYARCEGASTVAFQWPKGPIVGHPEYALAVALQGSYNMIPDTNEELRDRVKVEDDLLLTVLLEHLYQIIEAGEARSGFLRNVPSTSDPVPYNLTLSDFAEQTRKLARSEWAVLQSNPKFKLACSDVRYGLLASGVRNGQSLEQLCSRVSNAPSRQFDAISRENDFKRLIKDGKV